MKEYEIKSTSFINPEDGQLSVRYNELGANIRKFDSCAGSDGKWYEEAFIADCYLPLVYNDQIVFNMVVNMNKQQKEDSLTIRHKLQFPEMYTKKALADFEKKLKRIR